MSDSAYTTATITTTTIVTPPDPAAPICIPSVWTDPLPGCTCGFYWSIVPPGPYPHHSPLFNAGPTWSVPVFQPPPPRLTDEDIERIARRVAEMLKPKRPVDATPDWHLDPDERAM